MGNHPSFPEVPAPLPLRAGLPIVHFVGAGPGDPDLLTVRALKLLRDADVVLHDALVSDAILNVLPATARRIAVGKRAGKHSIAQSEINGLLVSAALGGGRVVRLKGGDPAIFARLAEEIEALRAHGIPYEIVPGITAASAAAASSGIPLTWRGQARRVQFVAAQSSGEGDLDWAKLADAHATTVFYMARQSAKTIARQLVTHGLSSDTPVLLVSEAGSPNAIRLHVSLSELPRAVSIFPASAPLVVVVGCVADFAACQPVPAAADTISA